MLVDIDIIMRVLLKSTYQISISRERTTTTKSAHTSLLKILFFLFIISLSRVLKMRSKNLAIMGIPLEVRHLNNFKNYFK